MRQRGDNDREREREKGRTNNIKHIEKLWKIEKEIKIGREGRKRVSGREKRENNTK